MVNKKLILLDRDGVINFLKEDYVRSLSEFRFMPGIEKSLYLLSKRVESIAICSNQRGVSLGVISECTLSTINTKIKACFSKDFLSYNFYYCTHSLSENCECRKPKAGLLKNAINNFRVDLDEVIFIGDSTSDFFAAQNANIDFGLVLTGNGMSADKTIPKFVKRYKDLNEFINFM